MVTQDPRSKASDLIRQFYRYCEQNKDIRIMQDRPPFVYYGRFKDFIMKTKGADPHTIRAYRDQLLAFKFIEIDHLERVFFTFKDSPDYRGNTAIPINKFFSDDGVD
jgi:hypothetical protein